MTYAFTFDASACSGCKACQAACKDKNGLPLGVLWRRVYEVSGGEWYPVGGGSSAGIDESDKTGRPAPTAWTNTVFAYNMSIACNHCARPKCAGVCPADAYNVREDGIVYIDESKCVGCGYCAWACPYSAPQYNRERGCMTKCNFCYDNIDAGNPPACVAACPLRVLNYVEIGEQRLEISGAKEVMELWKIPADEHPFPMSPISRTEPHLAIKPHAAMNLRAEKNLANREEIHPREESAWDDIPLLIFTLLAQMSVGAFWFTWLIFPQPFSMLPLAIIGASLGLGMFFSFAHLGTKKNAWRVLNHLRKSWLSREILSASLFGAGWLAVTVESFIFKQTTLPLSGLTALFGFFLIHSMSQVYRLRPKPAWNTWRTNASFFISALALGMLVMLPVLIVEGIQIESKSAGMIPLALVVLQWGITRKWHARNLQTAFSLAAVFAMSVTFFVAQIAIWNSLLVFLLVLAAEVVGRQRFYATRRAV